MQNLKAFLVPILSLLRWGRIKFTRSCSKGTETTPVKLPNGDWGVLNVQLNAIDNWMKSRASKIFHTSISYTSSVLYLSTMSLILSSTSSDISLMLAITLKTNFKSSKVSGALFKSFDRFYRIVKFDIFMNYTSPK